MSPPARRSGPLRLLHIHSSFDPGDEALRAVRLINRFGPACAHSIVSAVPAATGAVEHIGRGIPALQISVPGLAGRPSVRSSSALATAMRGYDLILTYGWGAMNAVLAHTLFGPTMELPALIHHEQRLPADETVRAKPLRNAFRMLALARAQALIVPSQQLEATAIQVWKQPTEKVHRIPPGVPTRAYATKPARDALPRLIKRPGELWLGSLADLHGAGNLPRLVRAFAVLPEPWQLVIVGEGPGREAIVAEAARIGLADRVHLPGSADSDKALGLFDLFALSSDSEPLPLALIEAMAAGLAVVSPAVGEAATIVSAANARYLTPAGDDGALADALGRLAADAKHRRAVGADNRVRARSEYDEATMASRHAAVYARVMGRETFP
jgi:glycosyltransferase involved in cell wall biosynthesis